MKAKSTTTFVVGIITALFIISAIGNSAKGAGIEVTIPEKIAEEIMLPTPKITTKEIGGEPFTNVGLGDAIGIGMGEYEPKLPAKTLQLVIPYGKTIKEIHVEASAPTVYECSAPVRPYFPPVPIGTPPPPLDELRRIVEEYKERMKNIDEVIPGKLYSGVSVGYCRGYTIVSLTLHPVQYVPAEGKLYFFGDLKVDIELKDGDYNRLYRASEEDREYVASLVDNPDALMYYPDFADFEYEGGICDPSEDYDYVVIVTEDLKEDIEDEDYNFTDLFNQKATQGLSCTVVTVEDIEACSDYYPEDDFYNDTPYHIREFCKDAYIDWGTQYFLIVGDNDGTDTSIERREMDYDYESNCDTDIYWNHLDEYIYDDPDHGTADRAFNWDRDSDWGERDENDVAFDKYSDAFIGSIPADEGQDFSNWLKKSLYYEQATDKDYLENVAGYGGNTGWNCEGDDFIDFTLWGTSDWRGPNPGAHGPYPDWLGYLYGYDDYNAEHPGAEFNVSVLWTAEPPNPGWSGGSESAAIAGLRNDINNNNVTILWGVAHANCDMSLDVNSATWIANYHNTKPFFIHDYGCHCGDMDACGDGVLHAMLFASDTERAFACVYNTGYGWGSFDDTNSSSAIEQKFWVDYMLNMSKCGGYQNWQLGRIKEWARDSMAPMINWTYSGAPGSWRGIIESCLLFGDPALTLKPPVRPEHNVGVMDFPLDAHQPADEDIWINATIFNNGNHTEYDVVVNLVVNGTVINNTTIAEFEMGTVVEVSFLYHTPSAGWETICINITPVPNEDILYDNERCVDVVYGADIEVAEIVAPDYLGRGFAKPVKGLIRNIGPTDESSITVQLIANNTVVNSTVIGLNQGEQQWVTFMWDATTSGVGTYNVTIKTLPVPTESYIKNNEKSHTVKVFYPNGIVLLVDDDYDEEEDRQENYQEYYELALYGCHWAVEIWNNYERGGPPSPSYMQTFSAVVWETGDNGWYDGWYYYQALNDTERAVIQQYLSSGVGRLFISGQGIAEDAYLNGWTDWLEEWFHAEYAIDMTYDWFVEGVAGDPIGDGLTLEISSGDGAKNQFSQDGIYATSDAFTCFEYQSAPYDAGVRYRGAYALVYFSFGFEAINTYWDRKEVMCRILDWMVAEHDMAVISLDVPEHVDPDVGTYVNASVINGGLNTETGVWVNFTATPIVNGTLYQDSYYIASIDPGEIEYVSFDWGLSTGIVPGIYEVSVEVWDDDDEIPLDDMLSQQVIVGPDISVDYFYIVYHGEVGDTRVYLEEEHEVIAHITNLGVTDETGIKIQLTVQGVEVDNVTIDLDGGESTFVTLYWTPHTEGLKLVRVKSVPQTDEYAIANNVKESFETVVAVPNMYTSPDAFDIELDQGDIVDNDLIIGNNGTADLNWELHIRAPGIEEGFEPTFPPGWERWDYGDGNDGWNDNDWHLYQHYSYGWVARVYYSPYENQDDWLVSPTINCADMTNVTLKFWHYYYGGYYTPHANATVLVSNDNGATWHIVKAYEQYPGIYGAYETVDITQWAAGYSQVKIAFRWVNEYAHYAYWYVDRIWVGAEQTVDIIYSENFDTNDGGYTHDGDYDEWEWGEPSYGPDSAHSEPYCWGIDLDNEYENAADESLYSIEISLDGISETPYLTFWHWYDIESSFDGGNVKISTDGGATWEIIYPTTGYPEDSASGSNQGIPYEPCFSGSQPSWTKVFFNLEDYVGEDVIIRWHFGSDWSVTYPGWYIDDVQIETVEVTEKLDVDFGGGFPPEGWQVIDYIPSTPPYGTWSQTYYSGRGYVARAYYNYISISDTALIAPLDCRGMKDVHIGFEYYVYDYYGYANYYFDISTDGGLTWTTIDTFEHTWYSWISVEYDISDWADGREVLVRWRYQNPTTYYSYWYLNNVYTTGQPIWIEAAPMYGITPPGSFAETHVTVTTSGEVRVGDYNAWIYVDSNDPHKGKATAIIPVNMTVNPVPHQIGVGYVDVPPVSYVFEEQVVHAVIENRGTTDEYNIVVQLLVNGSVRDETVIDYLPARTNGPTTTEVQLSWFPFKVGHFTIEVYAVPVEGETVFFDQSGYDDTQIIGKPDIEVEPLEIYAEMGIEDANKIVEIPVTITNNPETATGDLEFNVSYPMGGWNAQELDPDTYFYSPYGMGIGDIDGDGYDDIAVGDGHYSDRGYIYDYNPVTGEYELVFYQDFGNEPIIEAVAVGDADNDGKIEALFGGGDVYVVGYNEANGQYEVESVMTEPEDQESGIVIGDMDGDGYNEVLIVNILVSGWDAYAWWMQNASGDPTTWEVQEVKHLASYMGWSQMAQPVGDLDGDGIPEVMTGGYASGGAHLWNWNGEEYEEIYFWTHPGGWYNSPSGCAICDLDGDGDLEIVVSWAYSGEDGVHAYEWTGDELIELDYYPSPGMSIVYDVYACDYDLDGQVEILQVGLPYTGGDQLTVLGWDDGFYVEDSWSIDSTYLEELPMVWSGNTDDDRWIELGLPLSDHHTVYILSMEGTWQTVSPTEGVLGIGESMDLTVTINGEGMDVGVYEDNFYIYSNDPDEPVVAVHKVLNITARDTTPPVSQLRVVNDPNGFVGPISTFIITASDDQSPWRIYYRINGGEIIEGDINTSVSFQLPGDVDRYVIEYWAQDLYPYHPNEEEHHEEIYYFDATPPTTTLSFDGTWDWVDDHYEISSSTLIVLTAEDEMVDVREIQYKYGEDWLIYEEPFTLPQGSYVLYYRAIDVLDNYETVHIAPIEVSGMAPTTTCSLSPSVPDGNNGWYVGDVTVTLNAIDSDGKVDTIYYRIDSGEWQEYTETEYPLWFTITEDGSHILEYYAVDNAGNSEPVKTVYINIDKFAPEINVIKPKNALYIFGREILPLRKPVIIGDMHIEVDITDPHTSGVEQAQLIIDGEIQDIFTNHIEWIWSGRAAGLHTITIVASDKAGNEATKEIQVIIFNL